MQRSLTGYDRAAGLDARGKVHGAPAVREALAPLKVGIAGAWLIKQVVMVGIGWHKSRIVDKPPC
jgi:hypothetical protein